MKKVIVTLAALSMVVFTATSFAAPYQEPVANTTSGAASNQGQGQSTSIDSHNVSYASDLGRLVPGVVAPALTTTLTETCMGSTSMGVGWSGAGFSFGTTWRDSACVRRLDARQLVAIHPNLALAAKELMCDSDAVYDAMKRAKMPCAPREDDKELQITTKEAELRSERLAAEKVAAEKKAAHDAEVAANANRW